MSRITIDLSTLSSDDEVEKENEARNRGIQESSLMNKTKFEEESEVKHGGIQESSSVRKAKYQAHLEAELKRQEPKRLKSAANTVSLFGCDLPITVLRESPTPILILHAKQRVDYLTSAAMSIGADHSQTLPSAFEGKKWSSRKCGFAENAGGAELSSNGKNCDDNYSLVADTVPSHDPNKIIIDSGHRNSSLSIWYETIIMPILRAVSDALGSKSNDFLQRRPASFSPDDTRCAEMRVLLYENGKKQQMHRHFDHGMYGLVVLLSLGSTADFFIRVGPDDERVIQLKDGDILVFDASRKSQVFHGVDAICNDDPRNNGKVEVNKNGLTKFQQALLTPGSRVSIQWRLYYPELGARVQLAWCVRNLYSFEPDLFEYCCASVGLAGGGDLKSAIASPKRKDNLQFLVDFVSKDLANRVGALMRLVSNICAQNEAKYLSAEIYKWNVGGHRCQFESAWHIDKECSHAAFEEQVRVDLPLTTSCKKCKCSLPARQGKAKSGGLYASCSLYDYKSRSGGCGFFEWIEDNNMVFIKLPPLPF